MYSQDISGCLRDKAGANAPTEKDLERFFPSLEQSLIKIKKQHAQENLPHFTLPYVRKDLQDVESLVFRLQDEFSDLIILGTGGSSLGAQTLCSLSSGAGIRLHFIDNVDPETFTKLFSHISCQSTAVLAVSKSGETVETLVQFLTCIEWWRTHGAESALSGQFFVITEDKKSSMRLIAEKWDMMCLPHDPNLGGRFSVFSLVGLLPAIIAGVDVLALREGAAHSLECILTQPITDNYPAMGVAVMASIKSCNAAVMMPYCDKLKYFAKWYRQLWAESLGKKGKGIVPIDAHGTVDQHSQLQLYLDGPKDKFFTLIGTQNFQDTLPINTDFLGDKLDYLKNHTMADVLTAEFQATVQTLIRNNCPTRTIIFDKLDAYGLGGLLMQFMVETLLMSDILGVNPFDQPAVEEGKVLTKDYLKAMYK